MQRSRHIGAVVILGVGLLWSASLGAQIQQVTLANGQTYEVPTKDAASERAFWTKAVKDAFKRDPAWLDQVNARVSQAK